MGEDEGVDVAVGVGQALEDDDVLSVAVKVGEGLPLPKCSGDTVAAPLTIAGVPDAV